MSSPNALQPDPSVIGGVPKAPFVRLPEPASVFARRAARFRALTAAGALTPYLEFLAALTDAQGAVLANLPDPDVPSPSVPRRAGQFAMPPLDRSAVKSDAALRETFERLFAAFAAIAKPEAAEAAFARLRRTGGPMFDGMIANVVSASIPLQQMAEHVYVAAALQVHFTRLASRLDSKALVPIRVGSCPACGGPPVTSLIVGWYGAEGARYASCALCSTLWNEVRVKCLACGSTKGVGYQEVDGQTGTIKAETCDECRSYVKILHQHKEVMLDPVADDVGSLGLDLLLRDSVYRRAGVNPYLLGY